MRRALDLAIVALVSFILGAAAVTLLSPPAEGQQNVVVAQPVRDYLARAWDAQANDPYQLERAYCLTFTRAAWASDTAYVIVGIAPAKTFAADHNGVAYFCAPGLNVSTLHVHPPATCDPDTQKCELGGAYAYQCFPSTTDRQALRERKEPFHLIQCDRNAVVPYFPSDVALPEPEQPPEP